MRWFFGTINIMKGKALLAQCEMATLNDWLQVSDLKYRDIISMSKRELSVITEVGKIVTRRLSSFFGRHFAIKAEIVR